MCFIVTEHIPTNHVTANQEQSPLSVDLFMWAVRILVLQSVCRILVLHCRHARMQDRRSLAAGLMEFLTVVYNHVVSQKTVQTASHIYFF